MTKRTDVSVIKATDAVVVDVNFVAIVRRAESSLTY